jgi:hypothetical protein
MKPKNTTEHRGGKGKSSLKSKPSFMNIYIYIYIYFQARSVIQEKIKIIVKTVSG